jgi:pyrroloquinoline-quinone synthase
MSSSVTDLSISEKTQGEIGQIFRNEMRRMVDEHPILNHRFFTHLRSGSAKPDTLITWALQDRHVAYMFPRLIALVVAGIPAKNESTVKARMPLIENLWEEAGEGTYERAHSTLMDALLISIGVPAESLYVEPLASTRRFIDLQFDLSRENALAGAGAFCYANEYLALKEYPPIQDAILASFPGANIRFFEANWEVDGHHTELAEECIVQLCESEEDFGEARRGAETALVARMAFYDELCRVRGL